MKVLITGGTGMIGSEIQKLCIHSDRVSEIVSLVRKPSSIPESKKIKFVTLSDFNTYDNHEELFKDVDVAFFCIGVYTGQVTNDLFKEITVDYTVNFAKMLSKHSPNARLCLLSGAGADRTEKSRTAFARFKGIAENQLSKIIHEFHTFRPGYIYPVEPRNEPSRMYRLMRTMYPIIRLFGKNASIKSTDLAKAMFTVGINGADKEVFENRDIVDLNVSSINEVS